MLGGERVDYDGKTLTAKRFRLGGAPAGAVPIYLGALNEQSLRLTGELCDGVVLNMVPERALPQILGAVRAGAEAAGRDPAQIEVVARLHVVMTDDAADGPLRWCATSSAPMPRRPATTAASSGSGFADGGAAIRECFAKGDRAGVAAAVTDGLCDAMAVIGNAAAVRARVRAYAEQGSMCVCINPIADPRRRTGRRRSAGRLAGRPRRAPERRAARDARRLRVGGFRLPDEAVGKRASLPSTGYHRVARSPVHVHSAAAHVPVRDLSIASIPRRSSTRTCTELERDHRTSDQPRPPSEKIDSLG